MGQKTLIFHDGALGDLLLSLPLIKAISRESTWTHLVGRPDAAGLLRDAGHVREITSAASARLASLFTTAPDDGIRRFLSGFDRSFLFTAEMDPLVLGNIRSIIADTHAILTIPREEEIHVTNYRAGQLETLGIPVSDHSLHIPPAWSDAARGFLARSGLDEAGEPLVSIHAGSGSRRKNWPFERFLELLELIGAKGRRRFLFLSGPAEERANRERVEAFASQRPEYVFQLQGADLGLIAALLEMSSLYIGNDSGITHLASSVNDRVIALFGPTNPILWRPWNSLARVIAPSIECAPCGERMKACNDQRCLMGITAERVHEEVAALLGDLPPSASS